MNKEEIRIRLDKKAKEQYNTSGSFSATPFGIDGIPFARRDAIVDFTYEILEEYSSCKSPGFTDVIKYLSKASKLIESFGEREQSNFNRGIYFSHVGDINKAIVVLSGYYENLKSTEELKEERCSICGAEESEAYQCSTPECPFHK